MKYNKVIKMYVYIGGKERMWPTLSRRSSTLEIPIAIFNVAGAIIKSSLSFVALFRPSMLDGRKSGK